MSLSTGVELDIDGPIARLRLSRPDKLNALSSGVMRDLITAASRLDSSPDVRVVVVSGAGAAFCAGFDVAEFTEMSGEGDARDAARLGAAMTDAIESMRPITIAQLHGRVVGGGLVVAACCDLRVAADDTAFSIPEVDLGIPLLWGGIPRLVREIGPALTKELVMTCRTFTAAEAKSMGFLSHTVPADAVEETADALAVAIASRPWAPVEMTKRQVAAALGRGDPISDQEALLATSGDVESLARRKSYLRNLRGS